MGIKERVIEFIEYKNMPIKQFEERCMLSNGYISSMRKGFGSGKLDNVLREFPDLNRDWLLYGEGEMLKSESIPPVENQLTIDRLLSIIESQQRTIENQSAIIENLISNK